MAISCKGQVALETGLVVCRNQEGAFRFGEWCVCRPGSDGGWRSRCATLERVTGPGADTGGIPVSLYKILFHFTALVWESIILVLLPPTCKAYPIAILLHDYCAIYDPSPTPLLYAIHHTILVMTISCKGQDTGGDTQEGYRRGYRRLLCGGEGGCAGGGVPLGAVPALSWCGEVSLGGLLIINQTSTASSVVAAGSYVGNTRSEEKHTILHYILRLNMEYPRAYKWNIIEYPQVSSEI